MALTRSVITLVGGATAGPLGSALGNIIGGLLEQANPAIADILKNIAGNLGSEAVRGAGEHLILAINPKDPQRVNHDLQAAFREAFRQALYDLGGRPCFPNDWKVTRDT